jgi:hypothetical protein
MSRVALAAQLSDVKPLVHFDLGVANRKMKSEEIFSKAHRASNRLACQLASKL